MNQKVLILIIICIAFLLNSCKPALQLGSKSVTSEDIRKAIQTNHSKLTSLRASGRISIESPQITQSVSFDLNYRNPDSLIIKLEGPFGIDIGELFLTKDKFHFYNSMRNEIISGVPTAERLNRIVYVQLSPEDILNLPQGGNFMITDNREPDNFGIDIDNEQYVMTYKNSDGKRIYWIDPETLQLSRIRIIDPSGETLLEEQFLGTQTENGVMIPRIIRILREQSGYYLLIAYSDIDVNTNELDFRFEHPKDAPERIIQ